MYKRQDSHQDIQVMLWHDWRKEYLRSGIANIAYHQGAYIRGHLEQRKESVNIALCANGSAPVSYTHLDVYKRQLGRYVGIRGNNL